MKKFKKIVCVLIMITTMFFMLESVYAAVNPNAFTGSNNYDTNSISTLGNNIIQIVSVIGSIASVIVLIVLGLKYMMGSAEEKAEYKKTLLPYIIGAALVFAASSIAAAVFNFTQNIV